MPANHWWRLCLYTPPEVSLTTQRLSNWALWECRICLQLLLGLPLLKVSPQCEVHSLNISKTIKNTNEAEKFEKFLRFCQCVYVCVCVCACVRVCVRACMWVYVCVQVQVQRSQWSKIKDRTLSKFYIQPKKDPVQPISDTSSKLSWSLWPMNIYSWWYGPLYGPTYMLSSIYTCRFFCFIMT